MSTTIKEKRTYRIPMYNIDKLREYIEIHNRDARRRSLPEVKSVIGNHRKMRVPVSGKLTREITFYEVDIVATIPVIDNWQIVALMDVSGPVPLFRIKSPSIVFPVHLRYADKQCMHCKTNRHRKYIYVLKHKKEENYLMIGRSCLRDFLDIESDDYERAIEYFYELLVDIEDGFESIDRQSIDTQQVYNVNRFLGLVALELEHNPYITAKEATGEKTPTSKVVMDMYESKHVDEVISEENTALATAAIDWIRHRKAETDFEKKIQELCVPDHFAANNAGVVAYLIPLYLRNRDEPQKSEFIGSLGDTTQVDLRLIETSTFKRGGKSGFLYKFVDTDGNRCAWFAYSSFPIAIDDRYTFEVVIEGHKEFRGVKETTVSIKRIVE